MLGNEAVARGIYEAGGLVVSSYPGTPSTEITESAAEYPELYVEWAPNEKVALEVAIGAAIAGGRAVSGMKHVGLNVAADPLFTASYTGINGGLVICVADDPGMHSSQNEQDSRHFARASKTLMLEPSDSAECKEFTKAAFELSERFDTPVLLRLTTRVAHSQSLVELCDRVGREPRPYEKQPLKYVMMPGMARARHIVVEKRIEQLKAYAETSSLNKAEYHSKKIGIITSGVAYQYAKDALGETASYLKLGMVYPLPSEMLKSFVSSVDACYVFEELDPYIEEHCRALGLNVTGKEKFSLLGEYNPQMLKSVIMDETALFVKPEETLPARPPVMCAGCPHRSVFHVLEKLKLTVSGDIGCYTLAALPPLGAIDSVICMGASIGVAHGMEKIRPDSSRKTVAVIGDSTFMHSGITGLVNVAYNKGTATTIILDNSITGMTGHQENPTTGKTIRREPTAQINLEKLCQAIVPRVVVADPFDLEKFEQIVKEETAVDEPSVIIARRPCALLKPAPYSGFYFVNDKCKRCGVCRKIGCPAITSLAGGAAEISKTQCAGCGLCERTCRFGAIERGAES